MALVQEIKPSKKNLFSINSQTVLGNEAIAFGLFDEGVEYAASYPGTPSTEVMDQLLDLSLNSSLIASWSTNEAVAFEEAAATAITGTDSAFVCKSVGINVAMDPLMTLANSGVNGAFVIVVADDPGMHSSQNEQDNRLITLFSRLPMFEPSSVQECYDLAREAVKLSKKYKIPVMLRSVTRVSHALGIVTRRPSLLTPKVEFKKNPQRFVNIPGNARKNHHRIIELRRQLKEEVISSEFWEEIKLGANPDYLVVTSGSSANYTKEAITALNLNCHIFIPKLIAPFPERKIIEIAPKYKKLIVIEELEPYLETKVKHVIQSNKIKVQVYGKEDGITSREGELTTEKLMANLAKVLNINYEPPKVISKQIIDLIKIRPPVLCAGCPHRSTYVLIDKLLKKSNPIYCNDIGCYSLGVLPPHNTADILICMGASIPMATSISLTKPENMGVALIGDSTFWHSGIPGLANAIWKNVNILIVIMDNQTTAMTGDQPNPSATNSPLDIAKTVEAMGAKTITINPMDFNKYRKSLQAFIKDDGVKVIVSKYPCALNIAREIKKEGKTLPLAKINEENCNGCNMCIEPLGCPALTLNKKRLAQIDPTLCNGCMYCQEHCHRDAIMEVER